MAATFCDSLSHYIFIIYICSLVAGQDNYIYTRHSVSHPFTENGFDIPHWAIGGSTVVTDKVNKQSLQK